MIKISEPVIQNEEKAAVLNVLKTGNIVAGKEVEKFENEFSKYIGSEYAVATSSGTSALHTILFSLGLNKGDEVITTSFSFIATVNAIIYCGLKPVYADIDASTYNISVESIREILRKSNRVKAILIVHLFGQTCRMDEIIEICQEYNLILLEDAAQAHGAEYNGRKAGTFGEMAGYSFYATKNMVTGEGGMIVGNDKNKINICREFINHGMKKKYCYNNIGYNFRMTDIEAAMGRVQIRKLDMLNNKRRKNAKKYNDSLKNIDEIITPIELEECYHVYHQYVIRVQNGERDKLFSFLSERGIMCGIYYPKPLYKFIDSGEHNIYLKNVETISKEVLALPVHPQLEAEEIRYVIDSVKEYYD